MKTFNGGVWVDGLKDTGWRDISSYTNVVGTYDYDPDYDDENYNLALESASAQAYISRRGDFVQLVVDTYIEDGTPVPNVFTANIFPDTANSPLRSFGLPYMSAVSEQITYYTVGDNSTYKNESPRGEAVIIFGEGYSKDPGVGLVVWDRDFYDATYRVFETRRYTLSWITSDPFPKEDIGVKI